MPKAPHRLEGNRAGNSASPSRVWLGKREPLKEDSSLGHQDVEVYEVDLSKLLGGESFTLPCTISNKGLGIKSSTLIDTGANGYAFIDTKFAKLASYFLDTPIHPLPTPCYAKGFDR